METLKKTKATKILTAIMILDLFLVLVTISCHKKIYDNNYKGESNYNNFYVVDTIKIIDPITISSVKYGGKFVVSRSILNQYHDNQQFFHRPDVFLYGDDFYIDLPVKEYKRFKYPDYGGCVLSVSKQQVDGLRIFEFNPVPKFFIMGLISANFFYKMHSGYDLKQFIFSKKDNKISFYKIVYPLAE